MSGVQTLRKLSTDSSNATSLQANAHAGCAGGLGEEREAGGQAGAAAAESGVQTLRNPVHRQFKRHITAGRRSRWLRRRWGSG